MATTDLKLDEPGTLPRPGPVGRLTRLAFGVLCTWYVIRLVGIAGDLADTDGHIRTLIWNGILPGLFLISYVVNIGYSRGWRKWPAIVSGGVFLALAGVGYVTSGSPESSLLARTVWLWEVYLFTHLGLCFLVAAVIGTPGCEMRALHDVYSRISGRPTGEHICPVGPLNAIDLWEMQKNG
jgi:hypothetical protein